MEKCVKYKIVDIYNDAKKREDLFSSEYIGVFSPFIEFNEDGIVLTDDEFNIKYFNPMFIEKFIGMNEEKAELNNLKEIFNGGTIEKIAFAIRTVQQDDVKSFKFGVLLENENSETISYCVKVLRTYNTKGKMLFILTFHDKTHEKKLIEKYRYAKQKAESAEKAKTIFLSQMSHEIRTPLNKILSYSELIKSELEPLLSDELRNSFEIIERAGKRLVRTFDLLINLSEIQANAYKCVFRELDLIENVIEPVVSEYEKLAKKKGLTFEKRFGTRKIKITADHYSVTKILGQILDNAIKYTEKGGIEISLQKENKEEATLRITDSGIGIAEDYLPHIFDPFTQEESGYTREFDGNGIGLTVVKKFCELNNIKISVTSKKGIGTTVALTFRVNRKISIML
jgi:PAS domain S-box-containing protein